MEEYNLYIVLFAAVLPPFLLVLYIYLKDKYQREPLGQIVKGFWYGVLSAGIAIVLEYAVLYAGIVPDEAATTWQAVWKAFGGAAIPEEAAKLLMLWLLLKSNKYFDERFDGIVYAVCVGMGFAATENIIYLFNNIGQWQSVANSRALFAVPGHFMFAVAMGYFYSLIQFGDMRWRYASLIFLAPVLLHGVYDSLLFVAKVNSADLLIRSVSLLSFYVFCFLMLKYGRRRINEQLERDKKDNSQIAFWKEIERKSGKTSE
jgi:RsiW-degrading membrane proteinase PrsW (M82 family)